METCTALHEWTTPYSFSTTKAWSLQTYITDQIGNHQNMSVTANE